MLSFPKSDSSPGRQLPEDASAGFEERARIAAGPGEPSKRSAFSEGPANQRRSPLEEDNGHLEETAGPDCCRPRMTDFK